MQKWEPNVEIEPLERMTRDGVLTVLHATIDGEPIGKVNFVLRDSRGWLWLMISTRRKNWMTSVSPNVRDGYVAVADDRGLRIVADGFAFPNECRFDANETWLYIAETTGPFVTRLRIAEDGSVAEREIFGPEHHGGFIDGIAFDAFGNLWGTHVMIDRVFALTPEGDLRIVLDDDRGSPEGAALLAAFAKDRVTPDLMLTTSGTIAPWMASLTFGGAQTLIGSISARCWARPFHGARCRCAASR
jgi:sugar lactone lactonase YvrE